MSPASARARAGAVSSALARSPVALLALAAGGVFAWFAASNGGYSATTWYPGALVVLGLLVVALLVVPWARPPRLVAASAAAFAAYAAWSYLSIAWAAQKGDAWDGANRTALYALAFALFALWRLRGRAAAALIAAYALAVSVLGFVELIGVLASASPGGYFLGGRFSAPAGYQNADVALWFSAFWPCVALGARREVHPLARGAFVASAVALAGLALLGQSRGWLFAAPLTTIAFLALARGRIRTTLTLCLVAAASAAFAPAVLHVYDVAGRPGFRAVARDTTGDILIAAAAAGLVTAAVALADRRIRPGPRYVRATAIALVVAAVVGAGTGLGVLVANEGSPVALASRAWASFKRTSTPRGGRSRFAQTLGSHRYDFWRVAWGRFAAQPIAGIGADNYQEAYLARRRSDEEPRYPHSIELRTLSQTGIVGAILLGVAFAAALVAALRALALRAPLVGAAIAGALGLWAYWLIHGSVDWLWEFPGLGAPACAMLGLAAGMVPRPAVGRARPAAWSAAPSARPPRPRVRATRLTSARRPDAAALRSTSSSARRRVAAAFGLPTGRGSASARRTPAGSQSRPTRPGAPSLRRRLAEALGAARPGPAPLRVAGALTAAALAAAFAFPWLSALESNSALRSWSVAPRTAFDRLRTAAALNPLSAEPKLIAASVALRLGRLDAAARYFREAIAREPGSEYAHLELGLLLAQAGRRSESVARLARATVLDPRDDLARLALARVRAGRPVSIEAINSELARRARERLR